MAIYGLTALVIAYFSFRRQTPQLISAPIVDIFGNRPFPRCVGCVVDLLSIYAIAIVLAGSVAMGVFQVQDGVGALLNRDVSELRYALTIFGVLLALTFFPFSGSVYSAA